MDRKEAIQYTGGLSSVSKMPGISYGLPATACKTGVKLRKIPGSVCSKCYGRKGYYPRSIVRAAQERRLKSLKNGKKWIKGMAWLINHSKSKYFRWQDTGDLQNLTHLKMIAKVCELTPETKHRLPTKETGILALYLEKYDVPDNLVIRVSSFMIGEGPQDWGEQPICTSTVNTDIGFKCPATRSRKICGDCRACWNRKVRNIDYRLH